MSNTLRIARADPHRPTDKGVLLAPPRFVVAGQAGTASGDVKMYEWTRPEMRLTGLQTDVGQIRALAWSPIPSHSHLIAVGLSTGRTNLLSLAPSTLSVSSSPSPPPVLPVKHVRSVTSLSFCPSDPHYLAAGYERHRSDYSLLIWDIESSTPASSLPFARPAERLEPNNPIPDTHVQHYCPAEQVNDVSFLPQGYSLLASANNRMIRMYDLRAPAGPANQWNTRAVYGLSPLNDTRFASYEAAPGGSQSVVRLWDARAGLVNSFDVRGAVVGLEWAGSGKLGVGTRDGGVSLWDIVDGSSESDSWVTLGGVRNGKSPYTSDVLKLTRAVIKPKQPLQSFTFNDNDVLFVVRDGTIAIGPIPPTPIIASGSRGDFALASKGLSVLDPDTAVLEDVSEDSDSGEEEELINRFQLPPSRVSDILAESSRSRTASPAGSISGKKRKVELKSASQLDWADWTRVLRADVGWTMRRRAEEGYGAGNLLLNAAIATRYPGHDRLAGIWEFIHHLTSVMDPTSSTTRSLNLTYAGIHSIWTGQDLTHLHPQSPGPIKQGSAAWTSLRNTQHALPSRSHSSSFSTASPLPAADFAAALEHMNARRESDEHPGKVGSQPLPHSDKVPQRRMILAICGDVSDHDESRTRAASWAFFSGQEENAVRILMDSDNMRHRLFGTTLAGFLSQTRSTTAAAFFDEHWRSLVNRVDDPYLRAVLSRVGGDGWESVLEEEAVPLLDRIAIAVCNLPDDDLSAFINNRLNRFARNPSPALTSLALTGFTPPAVPILQKWLERTGDIQTVALLSNYFPISRLGVNEQESIRRWVEAYRDLLDGWGLWGERVEFDIGRMDIGKGMGEERVADDEVQHGKGVCPVCNNVLSKTHEEHLQIKSGLSREKSLPNERTGACTLCSQVLPRCVICLRHVESRFHSLHSLDDDIHHHSESDTLEQAYVCCLTCRHGGHANHIFAWFNGGLDGQAPNETCPVAGCPCECANI